MRYRGWTAWVAVDIMLPGAAWDARGFWARSAGRRCRAGVVGCGAGEGKAPARRLSSVTNDRRIARGVSGVLRGTRAPPRAVAFADSARGRPDDALRRRRDAAVQAVLPRTKEPPVEPGRQRAEMPPRGRQGHRPRRRRPHRAPLLVLRDARQLLVRRLLQGRGRRLRLGLRDEGDAARAGAPLGDRQRGRSAARARRGRHRDRRLGARRHPARADRAARQGQLLAGGRDRARAASARRSSTTAATSYACGDPACGPGHCDRYMEIYNLVFMEYDLRPGNKLEPLPAQNVDTGLGLERTMCVLQGVDSVFDTDGFKLIMDWVEQESGVAYRDSEISQRAHRVLADHGRAVSFLIAEGVVPSNEGRGYICRRLLRRAIQQAQRIGLDRIEGLPGDRDRADGRRVARAEGARRRDHAGRPRRGGAVPRDAAARPQGVRGARRRGRRSRATTHSPWSPPSASRSS